MFVSPALFSARKKWFLFLWLPLLKQRTKSGCNFEIWSNVSSWCFFPGRTKGWDLTVPSIVPDYFWVTPAPGLAPGYKMRRLHPASSTRTNKHHSHFRCIFYDWWQDFKITRGIHHNLLSFLYFSYILKAILEKRKPGDLKRGTNEPLVWLCCQKSKASSLRTLDSIVTSSKASTKSGTEQRCLLSLSLALSRLSSFSPLGTFHQEGPGETSLAARSKERRLFSQTLL